MSERVGVAGVVRRQELAHRMHGSAPRGAAALRSVYRDLYAPLLEQYLLHNHTASLVKALLLYRGGPQTVIVSAPFYLERARSRPPLDG